MKIAKAKLVGVSPYSQSRHYQDDEGLEHDKTKEKPDAYEIRTWRNRMHITPDGFVEIPGSAFVNALWQSAKRQGVKIKSRGNNTYAKHFEAGVMVPENLKLKVKAEDVPADRLFVPSDGIRGGSRRVTKYFPRIDQWSGEVTFYIFDDIIDQEIFRQTLINAGMLIGIGRFRPEKLGHYGRFKVESLSWQEDASILEEAAE